MKTFELPVSDCGCFSAGELHDVPSPDVPPGEELPKYGIVIWYKNKEVAKDACKAATNAHWGDMIPLVELAE